MSQVVLAWPANPAPENVTKYSVFEGATKLADVTSPSYTVQNAVPGVHTYTVAAVNAWGQGPLSDPVSTTPTASKPGTVTITIVIS